VLEVRTSVREISGARIELDQSITRQDVTIFQARVTLVCLDLQGRACRIPADIRHRLNVIAP
jgi:acyl-CoA thioester hydrolase